MTTDGVLSDITDPGRSRAAVAARSAIGRAWHRSRPAVVDLLLLGLAGAFVDLDPALNAPALSAAHAGTLALVAAATLLGAGSLVGLYPARHPQASFEGMTALWVTVAGTTALVTVVGSTLTPPAGGFHVVVVGALALVMMTAVRGLGRVRVDRGLIPLTAVHRAVVFGAGEAGANIIRVLRHNPASEIVPVALLDDDPAKVGMRLCGLTVLGGRRDIAEVVQRHGADTLLIAASSAGRVLAAELAVIVEPLGIAVRMLPPLEELLLGLAHDTEIRPIEPVQLLGRREVVIDLQAASHYLSGKRVLVTGAGGSIGSELCRQLSALGVGELMMLDRDESALHDVQLCLDGRGLLDDNALIVADIRDRHRLDDIFDLRRPEVVFHAAALKHLPLLQQYPTEAVKTNIWGTQNLLDSALRSGVERFVNISTDKAASAISVLGWSKRIGERLTASAAQRAIGPFVSVRFGNVLGSRGSVLTAFHAQCRAGGPLTVTHPDVTRYFMTVQEAVRLVIQSGAVGGPGEVLVLDMGEPVRIDDVARRISRDAERPVEIVYTGLRPGEKLDEVLLGADELDRRPHHPLISQVPVPPLAPCELLRLNGIRAREPLLEALEALADSCLDLDAGVVGSEWDVLVRRIGAGRA